MEICRPYVLLPYPHPDAAGLDLPEWAPGVEVPKGHLVHYAGVYQARFGLTADANIWNPVGNTEAWEQVGFGPYDLFDTTAPASFFQCWQDLSASEREELERGTMVYDLSDQNDYLLVRTDITPEDETVDPFALSPALASRSADPAIAEMWVRRGPANAFRMFDPDTLQTTELFGDTLVVGAGAALATGPGGPPRRIVVHSMRNVASVRVQAGAFDQTVSLVDPGPHSLFRPKSVAVFDPVGAFDSTFTLTVTFTRWSPYESLRVGILSVGEALPVGYTKSEARMRHLNFSRQTRDPAFGSIDFIRRGIAKVVSAEVYIDDAEADGIIRMINFSRGRAIHWDFNNDDTDYEHLKVWGYCKDYEYGYSGLRDGLLRLEVEGMAEDI